MDLDPLADVSPPRYAVESDEEEDEYYPLRLTPTTPNQDTQVKLTGELSQGYNLIVATGDIATYWARGMDLGEQTGSITVNNIQVGLVFNPDWTGATVIISEALTRLPVWCMHRYALTILESLKPTKIGLLDTYAGPSYIAEHSVLSQDLPIRYLTNIVADLWPKHKFEPFSPPNLIQSTSASLLSIRCTHYPPSSSTVVLVPASHIARPAPKDLGPNNFFKLSEDYFEWSETIVNDAQELLFLSIGEADIPAWSHNKSNVTVPDILRKSDVGDGAIYI